MLKEHKYPPFRRPRVKKTDKVRQCNMCGKDLPPTRYFNHQECFSWVDNYYDIHETYSSHAGGDQWRRS